MATGLKTPESQADALASRLQGWTGFQGALGSHPSDKSPEQASHWLQVRQALQETHSAQTASPSTPALVRGPSVALKEDPLHQAMMSPTHSVESADTIPVSSPGSLSVPEMLANIKTTMISKCRPVRKVQPPSENMCLVGQSSGRIKWIQPSGPRRPGEGIEDEAQGIVDVQETASGGVLLRVTLLASGFLIGPSGFTVREIIRQTDADIKSWTDKCEDDITRPTRTFIIEGSQGSVALALLIMCDAIARYKDLCEGAYAGQCVSSTQRIHSIDFSYQPPPRTVVPHAAGLKGQSHRMRAANGGRSGRMRMPVQESASTQIAARILADVKSHLSAEHASKAAARAQAGSPSVASGGRAPQGFLGQPSPVQVNVDAMHQHLPTSLGHQGMGGLNFQPPLSIPPGYAMISPGVLVSLEALQGNHHAASLGMLQPPYLQAPFLPQLTTMVPPAFQFPQPQSMEQMAPVTPEMGQAAAGRGGFWGVDASNMGAPTPGRCSPVFSVLDPQHPEASFGAGLPMASMHPLHNPAMPEGLYNQMMEPKGVGHQIQRAVGTAEGLMNPGSIAQDSDTMGQLRAEQALLEMAGRIGNLQGASSSTPWVHGEHPLFGGFSQAAWHTQEN